MKTKKNESMLPCIDELGGDFELKMNELETVSGGRRYYTDKEYDDYQSTMLTLNNKLIATKDPKKKKELQSHFEELVNSWKTIISKSWDNKKDILLSDFLKNNNVEL